MSDPTPEEREAFWADVENVDHLWALRNPFRAGCAGDLLVVPATDAEWAAAEIERLRAALSAGGTDTQDDPGGGVPPMAVLLRAYDVLGWLVDLKDGPRDATYEAEKPKAWAAARAALVASGSPAHREPPPDPRAAVALSTMHAMYDGPSPAEEAAAAAAGVGETRPATATRYEFRPPEMFQGEPMATAHMDTGDTIVVRWVGGDRWAIARGAWTPAMVWCEADQEWEWEPIPSSRDDAFKARTRYSLDEALTIGRRVSGEIT